MKFAVFGAGGVGGYLGARLADEGHEVHLIARGDHLSALRRDGLRIESVAGDTAVSLPATEDPAEIGPCDYVLFCVKTHDTREAAAELPPLVGADTTVVSFQNGIDNEAWLAEAVGEAHVVGGVAKIFSTIKAPGVVEHTGGPEEFTIGELDGRRTARIEALHGALSACRGAESILSDDVHVDLWRKFAFICAQAGMTAATRLPTGPVRDTPETWAMYRRVIAEAVAVGRAEGVDLPDGLVDDLVAFARGIDGEMASSMHYDLTHGKRLELEGLNGAVVCHAADVGVDVPMNEAIYALLRPWVDRDAGD